MTGPLLVVVYGFLTAASHGEMGASGADIFDFLREERSREVVSVATKRAQTIEEAPSIVAVYSDAQIRAMHLRTLEELLDTVASVRIIRLPNGEYVPVVRGIAAENHVSVLIDGAPANDVVTGQFAYYHMPLTAFKRVEVQRGPGSALYGGNAQAAVINLVTYAADDPVNEAGVLAGFPQIVQGRARTAFDLGAVGKLSLAAEAFQTRGSKKLISGDSTSLASDSLDARYPNQSLIDPANPFYVGARDEPETGVNGRVQWQGAAGLRLNSNVFYRSISPLVNPGPGGGRGRSAVTHTDDFQRQDLLSVTELSFKRKVASIVELQIDARYNLNWRAERGALTGPYFSLRDRDNDGFNDSWPTGLRDDLRYFNHTVGAEALATIELPFHNVLTLGALGSYALLSGLNYSANFENSTLRTGSQPTGGGALTDLTNKAYILGSARRLSIAGYVQDIFSPTSWVEVVGGVRLDYFVDYGLVTDQQLVREALCRRDVTCTPTGIDRIATGSPNFQPSPRGAVVFKIPVPIVPLAVKILYGRAFTPPPLGSLTNQTQPETRGGGTYGNPLLKSTTSGTFEAGISARLLEMHALRLTYFNVRTDQEVIFDESLEGFFNNAARETNGFEIEAQGDQPIAQVFRIGYRGAFGYQVTQARGGTLVGVGANVYPRMLGNLSVFFEVLQKFGLMVGGSYTGIAPREASDVRPNIPAFTLFNGALYARNLVRGFEFGVRVRNAFNTGFVDPLPLYTGIVGDFPRGGREMTFYMNATLP